MKDVTIDLPEGLEICCVFDRETPNDAFVSNTYKSLSEMPAGSVVGTSSLRRKSQLKHFYPKLDIKDLRGNVNTRLKKLDDGEYDAIILAAAGLKRLGFNLKELLSELNNQESEVCIAAERSMNRVLDGGCSVPIAGFAQLEGDTITLRGRVGDIESGELLKAQATASSEEAVELGKKVAEDLLSQGAGELLKKASTLA